MQLNGQQTGILVKGIRDNFLQDEFQEFLETRLNKQLHQLVGTNQGFNQIVYHLVRNANFGGWAKEMVLALGDFKPHVKEFTRLALELVLGDKGSSTVRSEQQLITESVESLVNGDPNFEPMVLIAKLFAKVSCVCRMELDTPEGTVVGTGFLVAADKVLTNYHVLEKIIDKETVFAARCRFDYHLEPTGRLNVGYVVNLDLDTMVIASSGCSLMDRSGTFRLDDPNWSLTELDYALIQLPEEIGNQQLSSAFSVRDTVMRGWIDTADLGIDTSPSLVLLQHPEGQTVKAAFGFNKLIGFSPNSSRMRYAVNTMKGSSGSPCFDLDFKWTALHNMGDPSFNPTFNQGIPARIIMADITSKGITLA